MDRRETQLENPEHQGRLQKWMPLLWIPPVALVVLMGVMAYCAR